MSLLLSEACLLPKELARRVAEARRHLGSAWPGGPGPPPTLPVQMGPPSPHFHDRIRGLKRGRAICFRSGRCPWGQAGRGCRGLPTGAATADSEAENPISQFLIPVNSSQRADRHQLAVICAVYPLSSPSIGPSLTGRLTCRCSSEEIKI